ncbi:MAG: RNA-binding S4 domain-containing protein [Rubrivivax sp.]
MNERPHDAVRLDKWLWAARFFKTRSLAAQAIEAGRVHVNGVAAKASRSLKPGDLVVLRQAPSHRTVEVLALSQVRGPAPEAQLLYAETAQSLQARQEALQARRFGVEPALSQDQGRPTKRDRRSLVEWQRWSAVLDPDE